MADIDFHIDDIAQNVMNLAQQHKLVLQGPAIIEYGFGWEPTATFWLATRRIHLYWYWPVTEGEKDDGLTVEVAETSQPDAVLLGRVQTYDELWRVFERYFHELCSLDQLPDCQWKYDSGNHDKNIPHPPHIAGANSGNVATFIEQMKVHGKRWQPDNKTGEDPTSQNV